MDITVKDREGKDVKLDIGELVEIKGSVFKVSQMSAVAPIFIQLEPGNADHVKQYNANQKAVKKTGEPTVPTGQPLPREAGESQADYNYRVSRQTKVASGLPTTRYRKESAGHYVSDDNGNYRRNDDGSYIEYNAAMDTGLKGDQDSRRDEQGRRNV